MSNVRHGLQVAACVKLLKGGSSGQVIEQGNESVVLNSEGWETRERRRGTRYLFWVGWREHVAWLSCFQCFVKGIVVLTWTLPQSLSTSPHTYLLHLNSFEASKKTFTPRSSCVFVEMFLLVSQRSCMNPVLLMKINVIVIVKVLS
jgi:hypothetical protein